MLLFYKAASKDKARVTTIHYQPDKLTKERQSQGITADTLPDRPAVKRGEAAALYCNPETGEVWYEVEARPLTPEEEIQDRLASIEERVARLETERK